MDAYAEARRFLDDMLEETGTDLSKTNDELAQLMSESAERLSVGTLEPGFNQALRAERNHLALEGGLQADDLADGMTQRVLGGIGGFLRILAITLA